MTFIRNKAGRRGSAYQNIQFLEVSPAQLHYTQVIAMRDCLFELVLQHPEILGIGQEMPGAKGESRRRCIRACSTSGV